MTPACQYREILLTINWFDATRYLKYSTTYFFGFCNAIVPSNLDRLIFSSLVEFIRIGESNNTNFFPTYNDAHDLSRPEGVDQPHGEGHEADGNEDVADVILK